MLDKTLERRKNVYNFIVSFWKENGYSPSHREISTALDGVSTSVVSYDLDFLQSRDYITFDDKTARSISVIDAQWIPPRKSPSFSE